MLWNCPSGDANGIADSLEKCPMCGRERDVPSVNRFGHVTVYGEPNAAQLAAQVPDEAVPTGQLMIDPAPTAGGVEVVTESPEAEVTTPLGTPSASDKAAEAKVALDAGEFDTALELLDQAEALEPDRADHWTKLRTRVADAREQW